MEINPQPDSVRASLRLPRAAFMTATATAVLFVAVLATALLAAHDSGALLMNVERMATDRENDSGMSSRTLDPVDSIATVETLDRSLEYEIVAEEDIRWLSDEVRYFNGRPIRPVRKLTMVVTAYSPDERSCGKWADGITASGYSVWTNGMKLVAADTSILPFGSLISVPGYDGENVVPVLDRGGAIKGMRLDVLYPSHERARRWGVQELEVTVWDYADGGPNDFRTRHR